MQKLTCMFLCDIYMISEKEVIMLKYVAVVILFIIVIFMFVSSNDEQSAFEDQMRRSPSTWTQREIDRYEGFMDWMAKN